MEEAQLVAIVIAIVGFLKMQSAKIAGLVVPVVALLVGIVVAFAYTDALPSGPALVATMKLGVKIGLVAVGGMHAVLYGATKVGEAIKGQTGPA